MSAFLFGQRAAAHVDQVTPRLSPEGNRALLAAGETPQKPSPRDKLLTTVAGLFPAEVIAFHAVLLGVCTKVNDKASPPVTTISEKGVLEGGFWFLVVLAVGLYVAGRINAGGAFKPLKDIPLAIVPATAFVAWAALQRTTAFDGISGTTEAKRTLIGLIAAGIAVTFSLAASGKTEKP